MSCAARKPNLLLQSIKKRGYAAQASTKPSSSNDVHVSVTSKNIRLVTALEDAPLNKVSFSFKAGSRYEKPDNYGIGHILRKSVGLSTQELTSFNVHRISAQYGFNLYTSVDRETFTLTIETHPRQLELALTYLNHVATKPCFKPWEIEDNRPRVKEDLSFVPIQAKVLDALHKAAYRNGLGNSLFVEPSRIGKFNYEHCLQYFLENFTAKRLQITSVGVDPSILNELISAVELASVDGPPTIKSTYYGGELRLPEYKDYHTYIAVAGETPGFGDKEYASYAVLEHLYANPPSLKYGDSQGLLNKVLTKTGILGAVSGLSASYSDSGLVGFFYVAESHDAAKGYDAVINAFLKSDITDKDVTRAKAQLKNAILSNADRSTIVDVLSKQINIDPIVTPLQFAAAVDAVTTADVKQAAKKLTSGKLSVVVSGEEGRIPYLDTIKK